MKTTAKRPVNLVSKLYKTKLMMKKQELAHHIPLTLPFSEYNLKTMLARFQMVYVKPDKGAMGVGVMRVEKMRRGYRFQQGTKVYRHPSTTSLCRAMRRHMKARRYLIQKGIHLLKYKKRHFDLRLMVQRNLVNQWEPTGMFGRVAHPHKAVTNGSQGGTIYSANRLIRAHANSRRTIQLKKKMNRLGLLTARQLRQVKPSLYELGLDIALDRNLKPWILEVNTRPDLCPFTLLADKRPLWKMITYGRRFGRRYKLKCTKAKRGN